MEFQSRRRFLQGSLALTGLSVLAGCGVFPTGTGQPAKLPRVGYLGNSNSPETGATPNYDAFMEGLRELGWVDGKSVVLETRWAEGRPRLLPDLAAELIALPVDVLVADDALGTRAAAAITQTLPILFAAAPDPVGLGLVCSLAHPCENVTGLSNLAEGLDGKRVELLKEAVPTLSRVGVLWHQPPMVREFQRTEAATQAHGIQLQSLGVADADGLPAAFQVAASGAVQALVVVTNVLTQQFRSMIVQLSSESRLPTMFQSRDFVDAGGLMSYGPSLTDQNRRAAGYVDKILKGAKPADLPVEQPTKFEFVINLMTAQTMGLTIHPSVLLQATEVIH